MKKLWKMIILLVCVLAMCLTTTTVFAAGVQSIYVKRAGLYYIKGDSDYNVFLRFDKNIGTAGKDVLTACGEHILINNKTVTQIKAENAGVTLKYNRLAAVDKVESPVLTNTVYLVLQIPKAAGIIKNDGNDTLKLIAAFTGSTTTHETPADFSFRLQAVSEAKQDNIIFAERLYRDDNLDKYETNAVTSISVPRLDSANALIQINFAKPLASRKLVNMQFRYKFQHEGLALGEFPLSQKEVDLFYNFGLITTEKPNSCIYNVQFGCPQYNDSVDVGTVEQPQSVLLEPKDTISGMSLYSIEQIQRTKPDNAGHGTPQPLIVQMHYIKNVMEIRFKGDELGYAIAPNLDQPMVMRFKSGLMFPNGSMLKEDFTFRYDNQAKMWINISDGEPTIETPVDETLQNQGGYTDSEIAETQKKK